MPALEPDLFNPLWAGAQALIPPPPPDNHPWGARGHRQRIPDLLVFEKLLMMLVTGTHYKIVADEHVSASTLQRRFREWREAGVFEKVRDAALAGYHKMIDLELDHLAIDGFKVDAPSGGEESGRNPTNRGKVGRGWINLVDARGVPLGALPMPAGASEHKRVGQVLDLFESRFPDRPDVSILHADAGYDVGWVMDDLRERGYGFDIVCRYGDTTHRRSDAARAAKRKPGKHAKNRWHVERTNKWYRDLRKVARCTERRLAAVQAWADLAHAIIVIRCLIREGWPRYDWDGKPKRNPFPTGVEKERKYRQRWERVHDWASRDEEEGIS